MNSSKNYNNKNNKSNRIKTLKNKEKEGTLLKKVEAEIEKEVGGKL
jgi:hypothetical protein